MMSWIIEYCILSEKGSVFRRFVQKLCHRSNVEQGSKYFLSMQRIYNIHIWTAPRIMNFGHLPFDDYRHLFLEKKLLHQLIVSFSVLQKLKSELCFLASKAAPMEIVLMC